MSFFHGVLVLVLVIVIGYVANIRLVPWETPMVLVLFLPLILPLGLSFLRCR